jgi:hypothetical protein
MTMSRKTMYSAISGGILLVMVGVGVGIGLAGRPEPKQISCRGIEMDNPLGSGVLMSPGEAERAFNPPVIRPQLDIASDSTIAELWVRAPRSAEVYIVYRSDMVVTVRPVNRGIREMASAFLAEGYSDGKLITIHGVPVFTEPPQRPCFGGNAVFNIGGAHVAVINDGDLPYSEVQRVAESAIETAPAVIAEDRALDQT